jgi:hypothetical protein
MKTLPITEEEIRGLARGFAGEPENLGIDLTRVETLSVYAAIGYLHGIMALLLRDWEKNELKLDVLNDVVGNIEEGEGGKAAYATEADKKTHFEIAVSLDREKLKGASIVQIISGIAETGLTHELSLPTNQMIRITFLGKYPETAPHAAAKVLQVLETYGFADSPIPVVHLEDPELGEKIADAPASILYGNRPVG